MKGAMTEEIGASSTVCPSGRAAATERVPTAAPAPGRFSTTMGWPRKPCMCGAMTRARMSGDPPGAKGLIRRIVSRGDQSCARAPRAAKGRAAAAASVARRVAWIIGSSQAGVKRVCSIGRRTGQEKVAQPRRRQAGMSRPGRPC
jgi:hypothetical protein